MTKSATRRRRWLFTPIILLTAAVIAWWGTSTERRRTAQVEWFVDQVLAGRDQNDQDIVWHHRNWPARFQRKLDTLRQDPAFANRTFVLSAGDIAELGDGSATHHVVISLAGTPKLGLRLMYIDGDRQIYPEVHIIGFWDPQEL